MVCLMEQVKCGNCQWRVPNRRSRGLCRTCYPDRSIRDRFPLVARATRTDCRHCANRAVTRPRGLCWGCFYSPGVRELYPSTSPYARRGEGNGNHSAPLPAMPTDALPGTEAKMAVLAERVRLRVQLHHPQDRTWADVR